MFKFALPAISWTLFFAFAFAIMVDAVTVTVFKGVILFLFFITGCFSLMWVLGSDIRKNKKD